MSLTDSPYSILANGFGSDPSFSTHLANGDPHFLSLSQEGGKHRPMLKPKPQSSNLRVKCKFRSENNLLRFFNHT